MAGVAGTSLWEAWRPPPPGAGQRALLSGQEPSGTRAPFAFHLLLWAFGEAQTWQEWPSRGALGQSQRNPLCLQGDTGTGGRGSELLPLARAPWWPVTERTWRGAAALSGHRGARAEGQRHLHRPSVRPAQTGFVVYSQSTEQSLCHPGGWMSWANNARLPRSLLPWGQCGAVRWGDAQ